ncbi:hypothetical protein LMTR13_03805 [Bradyrhizobium icense]|uniref:Uncharacterized protein n=1 Tax=Bradyrhizobium icense TaxID=1274631 RepID=A0A1B1U9M6_9BRAD|nr:hypothetical protein LMTR13_03805 [Bradyrhizobium icense]
MLPPLILDQVCSPFRRLKIFLRALVRFLRTAISVSLSRRSAYLGTFKKIELTHGVYFLVSVPEAEVKLMSVGAGGSEVIQPMTLSIDDTKQIFRSIECAFDHRDVAEIELGEVSWKTDCRVHSNPEKVTISFKRGWERTRTDVRRLDLARAIANFSNLFEVK